MLQEKVDYPAATPATDVKCFAASRQELQRSLVLLYAVATVELRAIPVLRNLIVARGDLLRGHKFNGLTIEASRARYARRAGPIGYVLTHQT